jgi:hypothetical protein
MKGDQPNSFGCPQKSTQSTSHRLADDWIQSSQRFIQQQAIGGRCDCFGKSDSPALSSGEGGGSSGISSKEFSAVSRGGGLFNPGSIVSTQPECDVRSNSKVIVERGILSEQADPSLCRWNPVNFSISQ